MSKTAPPADPNPMLVLSKLREIVEGRDGWGQPMSWGDPRFPTPDERTRAGAVYLDAVTKLDAQSRDYEVRMAQLDVEKARVIVEAARLLVAGGEQAAVVRPLLEALTGRLLGGGGVPALEGASLVPEIVDKRR